MPRPDDLPDFDPRPSIRIHHGMPEKGSVAALSDAAFRLMIEAICYCSREESDGIIPRVILTRYASKKTASAELIKHGHIADHGPDDWRLVDYLRWNRASSEINSYRESQSSQGALGAHKRWHVPRRKKIEGCAYCYPDTAETG